MWSENEQPTLSVEDLAKILGKGVRETAGLMAEYWRVKKALGIEAEKRFAEQLYREGPMRRRDDMLGAVPTDFMHKTRWLELHRASKMEKDCRGGELLDEEVSDFKQWLLKRDDCDHLRVRVALNTNRTGWTPYEHRLANAADLGRRQRTGTQTFDPVKKAWVSNTAIAT